MKQLIQNLKTGQLELKDVPVPLCKENGVLVRTRSSLISIGTEKSIIDLAKKSLLGKAKSRPDLFKRAVEKAKKEGFLKVFQESKERLDEPLPLGYSASGIVVEVGKGVSEFKVGDEVVICGGGFANHAEYNFVPKNLCVRLPKRPAHGVWPMALGDKGNGQITNNETTDNLISFEEGAFGMVGAICMHGVREARITPGETVLVIGLGLLGLISMQIIRAMGCFAMGVDIDPSRIDFAKGLGEKPVRNSNDPGLEEHILSFTGNLGVDVTIITAATKTNEPIETAQKCTRAKGRIVLVGVSDIHLDRKSCWDKELSFSVSRGDGPGMLDEGYIIKGVDYPLEYVRWTKKRNVEYFLRLIANGSVNVDPLITHRYPFFEAEKAYTEILKGDEKYIGVLFRYDHEQRPSLDLALLRIRDYGLSDEHDGKERVVGLIGGGMFAKNILLPEIRKIKHVKLKSIATTRGMTGNHIAEKYGFLQSTTNYEQILKDPEIDTVIITTQHDSHAKLVSDAIQARKNVFVEKPLCLTIQELKEIAKLLEQRAKRKEQRVLMVGYNRRFSPHAADIKVFFLNSQEPKIINYRINAGYIPQDHWTQDFERGGGRIIGEVCHFVDFCMFLTESKPHIIFAQGIKNGARYKGDDNLIVNVQFENGSIASIIYTAMGPKAYNREIIEVFSGGDVYHLIDFRKGMKIDHGKTKKVNMRNKDMGHKGQMKELLTPKAKELIPFDEIVVGMLATFSIVESLKTGMPVNLQDKIGEFSNKISEAGVRE